MRARSRAARPSRSRTAWSTSTSRSVSPRRSGAASRPVSPSATELRWPRMSVATAGVPHAAASVSDSPHPSASDALEHHPGPPILGRQVTPVDVAGELDPLGGAVGGHPRPQLTPKWTVADEPQAQFWNRAPSLGRRLESEMEALDRGESADGQHQRRRRPLPTRREVLLHTIGHRRHPLRAEAEFEQFLAGGLRRRNGGAAAVERRRDPGLQGPPHRRQRWRHDLRPHRAVDVMDDRDSRPAIPDRREPRNAVPDLYECVRSSHGSQCFGERGAREDAVPAASTDHPVAVPASERRPTGCRRCAVDDVQPGRRPPPHELVGVDLRPAGFDVVEIAPRQHVDRTCAGSEQVGGEVLDGRHGWERIANVPSP